MINLMDSILGAVSPDALHAVAGTLGEAPETTGQALKGIVPVLLAALVAKAEHGGRETIGALVTAALGAGNPLDGIGQKLADPLLRGALLNGGGGFTAGLLGAQFGPIHAAISDTFGIRGESSKSLLQLAGPLVAGGIGRATGNNPTPDAIVDLLKSQRSAIMAALPAGMSGLLTPLTGTAAAAAATAHVGESLAEPSGSAASRWLPWLLATVAALALIFGLRSCERDRTLIVEETPDDTLVTEAASPPPAAIPAGSGVTSEMRDDRPAVIVYFAVGESAVPADLAIATAPLRDYLAANPTATLTVSGYTDPSGDPALNAELAKNRAEQVAATLAANDIAETAITLEKPAEISGTADTDARSRRVEIVISP